MLFIRGGGCWVRILIKLASINRILGLWHFSARVALTHISRNLNFCYALTWASLQSAIVLFLVSLPCARVGHHHSYSYTHYLNYNQGILSPPATPPITTYSLSIAYTFSNIITSFIYSLASNGNPILTMFILHIFILTRFIFIILIYICFIFLLLSMLSSYYIIFLF